MATPEEEAYNARFAQAAQDLTAGTRVPIETPVVPYNPPQNRFVQALENAQQIAIPGTGVETGIGLLTRTGDVRSKDQEIADRAEWAQGTEALVRDAHAAISPAAAYQQAVSQANQAKTAPAPIDQAPPPEMTAQQSFTPQFRPSAPGSAFVKTGEQTTTQGGLESPYFKEADTAANSGTLAASQRIEHEDAAGKAEVKVTQDVADKNYWDLKNAATEVAGMDAKASKAHEDYAKGTQAIIDAEGKQKYNDSMMSRNPLQAIGFALAAGLQAYANGIMGKQGPNEVLGMMNQTMERDYATWKAARGQKRAEIEDRERALVGLDKKFKTDKEQKLAYFAMKHDALKAWAEQQLANTQLPELQKAKAQGLLEAAAKEEFAIKSQLGQITGSRTTTSETKARVSTGGGGPNPNTEEGRRLLTAMAAKDPVYQKILMVPDAETRKALEAEYAQYSKFKAAVPQIQAAFRDAADNATETAGLPGPDLREKTIKHKAGVARVKGLLKENMTGANSDADLENLINPQVPGVRDTPESQAQKLRTLLENAEGKMQFPLMKGMGIVGGPAPAGAVKQGFKK